MRKRIQCRVIRSIPLNKSGDVLHHTSRPDDKHYTTGDTAVHTYTPRLVVTTTCIDDSPPARFLDCRA